MAWQLCGEAVLGGLGGAWQPILLEQTETPLSGTQCRRGVRPPVSLTAVSLAFQEDLSPAAGPGAVVESPADSVGGRFRVPLCCGGHSRGAATR